VSAASKTLLVIGAVLVVAACHKSQPAQDQNIVIDDSANAAANADIEALPPDESSATPSNELANGSDNPDVNDLNASSNSY
jgi:hypothetical protein